MSLDPRLERFLLRLRVGLTFSKPGVTGRGAFLRGRLLLAGLALGYGLLGFRLHQLQIDQHAAWREEAQRQHVRLREIKPERGSILLRDGTRTVPAAVSLMRGSLLVEGRDDRDVPEVMAKLDRALQLTPQEQDYALSRLQAGQAFYFRRRKLSLTQLDALRAEGLAHVSYEVEPVRAHPFGPLAAQLIGLVSLDGSGSMGLETRFDDALRGQAGLREVQLDSRRRELVQPGSRDVPARPGHDVVLTVDRSVEAIVQSELLAMVQEHRPQGAAAVVVDPRNGDVLAMASWPDFDPEHLGPDFQEGLRNRCITDTYEPGSTIKPLLVSRAWELGLGGPQRPISCPQTFHAPGRPKPIRDSHHVGDVTESDVIVQSSNVGSYKITSRFTPEQLRQTITGWGLGDPTGVCLPGEADGNVTQVTHNKITVHTVVAVAQGYSIAVTPLQMAMAYAALANGGVLYHPRLVSEIRSRDGTVVERRQPRAVARVLGGGPSWQALREAMVRVVNDPHGTARRARSKTWLVAGKTGTTKLLVHGGYSDREVVASFCGFAPAEQPRIAFCVVAWGPDTSKCRKWGGTVAAPCAGRIAEQVLRLFDVPPSPDLSAKK